MPTGYTADVESGKVTDFRTFALQCARAFGACIMQRDDPQADPPKPREISLYYAESLAKARNELARLSALTLVQAEAAAGAEYERQVERNREQAAKNAVEQARYDTMIAQTVEWEPPTAEHQGLRDFMLQQLRDSKRQADFKWPDPKLLSAGEWLAQAIAKAERDDNYYTEQVAAENHRVEQANEWIRQLYESLDQIPV